jgi:CubicO group peptidase (beta-lactamase class C family)
MMDHVSGVPQFTETVRSNRGRGRAAATLLSALLILALAVMLTVPLATASAAPAKGAHRCGPPVNGHAKFPPAVPSHLNDVSPAGLDDYIRTQMETAHIPGLAACVIYDGDIVWAKGYGWADIEEGRRVTPDTDFMLASVSKTIVATAAMQQVEAGRLTLDGDVNSVLPFSVRNPTYPDDPITLFQLLTHTSSIDDYWPTLRGNYDYSGDSDIALRDFCEGYLVPGGSYYDPTDYFPAAPGSRYSYSNMGATLAALLVEEATGTPFDRYCDDNIFAPLRMNRTSWMLADLKTKTLAMPYRYDRTADCYRPYGHYGYPDYPDGQLRSSVSQLGRFLALYSNDGVYRGVRLLDEETVRRVLAPQVDPLEPGQGLIWYESGSLTGHNGGDFGVRTEMYFDPETGAGAIVLTNSNSGSSPERIASRLIAEAPNF